MKPNTTNNLSAWGFIGLFILFSMPYIGTPALILFAIFGQGSARSFARALLIISVIGYIIIFGMLLAGFGGLEEFLPDFVPDLLPDQGDLEVFRNIPGLLG